MWSCTAECGGWKNLQQQNVSEHTKPTSEFGIKRVMTNHATKL